MVLLLQYRQLQQKIYLNYSVKFDDIGRKQISQADKLIGLETCAT